MAEIITDMKTFSQVKDARWYPRYHIAAPFGWCNDPNGMCFYKGQYHFFYQHYPYAPQWGPMHWGHAVSDDLAYWKHLPIALKPDAPYEVGGGCFSGSAIERDGRLWLMYTGHISATDEEREATGYSHIEMQCLAYTDDGVHFKKYEINPVIEDIHEDEIFVSDIRDPKIWIHDGEYYAVLGSRTPDQLRGQVLLFKSNDLIHWSLISIAARSEDGLGRMWECPNFAKIDGHDVLVFSPMELDMDTGKFFQDKAAGVFIGKLDYKTGNFEHGDFQYLDKGYDFYAPQVMETPDGRTIMIGWLNMWGMPMPEAEDGWAGQMTIPRELHVRDGKIFSTPARELEKLRKWKKISHKNLLLDKATEFDGINGEAYELLVTVDAAKSKKFVIAVRFSEDDKTDLFYDNEEGIFKLDRLHSGATRDSVPGISEIKIDPCDKLKLHIFVDRSSVEVFINDGAEVISAKIYPTRTSQRIVFTPLDEVLAIDDVTYYKLDFGLPHPHIPNTKADNENLPPILNDLLKGDK